VSDICAKLPDFSESNVDRPYQIVAINTQNSTGLSMMKTPQARLRVARHAAKQVREEVKHKKVPQGRLNYYSRPSCSAQNPICSKRGMPSL